MMALAASNYSIVLVVVADCQGAQVAYSNTLPRCRLDNGLMCAIPRSCLPGPGGELMRPDIDWQSFRRCSSKVCCRSYLTPKKIGRALQNISFPSMVILGSQAVSAQSRLKKAVSHRDALKVNLALADQLTTLSTSDCKDLVIMSLLRAIARSLV